MLKYLLIENGMNTSKDLLFEHTTSAVELKRGAVNEKVDIL